MLCHVTCQHISIVSCSYSMEPRKTFCRFVHRMRNKQCYFVADGVHFANLCVVYRIVLLLKCLFYLYSVVCVVKYTVLDWVECISILVGPCEARGRCRITPPRFLAECHKRWLNQGSFVSAVCLVVYFLWFVLCLCMYFCDLYSVFSLLFGC